ncbi:hypothetical protein PITCH_A1970013 [uncultured Desulfobacterium sp.]|uniref:Nucleoside 2-deoxyribosyltransferase n=1 Tax=uncultured Desulfobacterium sp. TaxID=201089 RepID=A0A445MW79_9BACT|nr:hypothetical protein PITCH_A1970013 [uncultured Desulfobacterium sp.]
MKIYLAARYGRRKEMLEFANSLLHMGHTVTSRWIKGDHQVSDAALDCGPDTTRFAVEDLEDLMASSCCIMFSEVPRGTTSRGGRHVEFGIAVGRGMRCIVIGPRENVFHSLPGIEWHPDVISFLKMYM